MGEIQGTQYMRSHSSVHRATTKYFSNSFVFKLKVEKEGLPRDRTPVLGAGGPRFKSGRPDHSFGRGPSLRSGFRLRARTPAIRLKFKSGRPDH